MTSAPKSPRSPLMPDLRGTDPRKGSPGGMFRGRMPDRLECSNIALHAREPIAGCVRKVVECPQCHQQLLVPASDR